MSSTAEHPVPLPPALSRTSTPPGAGTVRTRSAGARRPLTRALVLAAVPVAVSITIAVIVGATLPQADPVASRLVAVLLMAVGAMVVVARGRSWSRIGAAGPASWTRPRLLAFPTLVALAPLVTGLNLPAPGTLSVLAVGYAATGVFEELWHRGVILDVLRPCAVRRSAVIGGALFAGSHLANIAFGQPVAVTLAQSVGAFCFGIGFSILRWRTNAVWLLAGVHAVGDLLLHITNLHGGALWGFLVGHDIVMLLWGLWCLRGMNSTATAWPSQTVIHHR